ncbi:hypothetical protein M0805_001181 [Coniferiporia weirii]|nr:hypothetical protein M0805_001181 [Coniferiporia weirii]
MNRSRDPCRLLTSRPSLIIALRTYSHSPQFLRESQLEITRDLSSTPTTLPNTAAFFSHPSPSTSTGLLPNL